LGERIALAVEKAGGRAAAVDLMGIPASTLERYIRNESEPQASKLPKIAEASGLSVEWLIYGDRRPPETGRPAPENGEDESDTVMLPLMNVMAEAGNGIENHDVAVLDHLPFSRRMLRSLGVSIEHAHVIQHTGDSMVPTLADGGICVIDTSKTRPRGGGIFALIVGNELLIKRLALSARGLTVISDNADKYPAETLTDDELGRVRVIGKVFWTGGEV
jgi:phage repressor protein C with HTH and peptisase S24 domain